MNQVLRNKEKYHPGVVARFRSSEAAGDFYLQCGLVVLWERPDREMLIFGPPREEWLQGFLPVGCIEMHRAEFCRVSRDETFQEALCRTGGEIWQFPGIALAVFRESELDKSDVNLVTARQMLHGFGGAVISA